MRRWPYIALVGLLVPAFTACADDADDTASSDAPDGFPEQDIRWIIPSSPGGGLDTTSRQIQPYWEEELGVSLAIENLPGGNFAVGATTAYNAPGDCNTILFHIDPVLHFSYMTQDVDYTYDDFHPIGRFTIEPSVVRVHNDAPWESMEDLIADAEASPGEIVAGTGGLTSNQYPAFLSIEESTGVDFNIVPYDGGGDARNALVAGEVDVVVAGVFNSLGIADESRVLGVLQPENEWPDLTDDAPTLREVLGDEGFPNNSGDYGVFVPTSCYEKYSERYEFLVETFRAATENEEYQAELEDAGELRKLSVLPPDEFDQQLRDSIEQVENTIDLSDELEMH